VADIFIVNIKGLVQARQVDGPLRGAAMSELPVIEDAYLIIDNGIVVDYGKMSDIPADRASRFIDASGRFVFPSFVDSHTHLIFPRSREEEFVMKIKGATYADIASRGGGILNSARRLNETSEEALYVSAYGRIREIAGTGTGAVEIKSGYGLSMEGELKMLRVAKRLKESVPLTIKTTLLAAHAVPSDSTKQDYIRQIVDEMIPAVAEEKLADYIDVFCEVGFFTSKETIRICEEGVRYGLKPRIHANQLGRSGGVQAGVRVNAVSVDHLENIGDEEIELLAKSSMMATVLPGAAFFLNLPMSPVRTMLSKNIPVVIASDYNPGSCPTGNLPLMISLACIRMKMTPEEAINAATVNAAHSLELSEHGRIARGCPANIFITKPMPSLAYFPYSFGTPLVDTIILQGKLNPFSS
jgi:imidazolonepropionase